MNWLTFDAAWMLAAGLPMAAVVVAWFAWRQRTRPRVQWLSLTLLRAAVLAVLIGLAARPMWTARQSLDDERRSVVLLIDRSESMSLEEDGKTRYERVVEFVREQLAPAIADNQLEARAYLFADAARAADGRQIAEAQADGSETNLASAIRQAVATQSPPPLAVIALTDGAATHRQETAAAVAALIENRVPLVGVGFGSDEGPQVVSVEEVSAPARVAPQQQFRIAVRLQAMGTGSLPPLQMLLERDGRVIDQKTVAPVTPPRVWQETFQVREEQAGRYHYKVRVHWPDVHRIRSANSQGEVVVTVTDEQRWKTLFVQGGLTWNYKFLQIAVQHDPAIELACLSRTANQTHFFQATNDSSLSGGFPATLDQLAEFRVVILANLKPEDLRPAQQQLLLQFCRESGGGVLLLGGAETFNVAWRGSPLEQLLPVHFHGSPSRAGPPQALRLTADAQQQAVFQLSNDASSLEIWRQVPRFTDVAQVESLKPGAQVWLEGSEAGMGGVHPPVLAVQRYGAGRSAALGVATLWRWRLAKHSDPQHFDRFWQQLIRYLGGGDSDAIQIHLSDQPLEPGVDLQAQLEWRADRQATTSDPQSYTFQVVTSDSQTLSQHTVQIGPDQAAEVTFRLDEAGLYRLEVLDGDQVVHAARIIELKDVRREFASPRRQMDHLQQWAVLSGGEAVPVENCERAEEFVERIKRQASAALREQPQRYPAGLHGGMLTGLLALLAADWMLRKRWGWR